MAPEAVMLLIDSSEYMRNGDFTPTRFEAQSDAVSVIFGAKIGANPENTVGVMTMGGAGGKGPEVLVTPTADLGKVLSAMHKAHIGGESDINTGIQVAQLALKHRQNKTQRQRIIILLGSPLSLSTDEKALIRLGKKLKKNNVAVDVVYFAGGADDGAEDVVIEEGGAVGGDEGVLGRFVESVGSGDNSHIISIPPGPHLLSDIIASSSILAGEGGYSGGMGGDDGGESSGAGGGGGGGGGGFEFGVDPEMDPELAQVLRMSMEEETARQQAAAVAASSASSDPLASVPESSDASSSSSSVPNPLLAPSAPLPNSELPPPVIPTVSAGGTSLTNPDEDAELAAALALSSGDVEMVGEEEEEDEDEEEAMRKAIEMSMQEQREEEEKKEGK